MQGQQDFSFVNKRGERRTKFFTNHLLFFFSFFLTGVNFCSLLQQMTSRNWRFVRENAATWWIEPWLPWIRSYCVTSQVFFSCHLVSHFICIAWRHAAHDSIFFTCRTGQVKADETILSIFIFSFFFFKGGNVSRICILFWNIIDDDSWRAREDRVQLERNPGERKVAGKYQLIGGSL